MLGIEAEITESTARATERDLVEPGDRVRVRTGRDLYLGGRIGFAISPVALG